MALPEGNNEARAADGLRSSDEVPNTALPVMEMEAPLGSNPGVHLQAVNDVLYSEIGISTLLARLKQSIASANDFAGFLRKRALLERDHAEGLRKLSKATSDAVRSAESRQGTYARQLSNVTGAHERMADNGLHFANSLQQMHDDLADLAANMERQRKNWKHEGLSNEKKVKDAEALLEKAKSRYDSSAESYERARTGDGSGRTFGIKGPKSAEQREEDLKRKLDTADSEYRSKVEAAQLTRQENVNSLRPQAIKTIQELVTECDNALTLQLQKYAAFNEKLLVGNGIIVSPIKGDANPAAGQASMRSMVQSIDNDKDFHSFIIGQSPSVPPKPAEIKYERHPTLGGQTSPTAPVRTGTQPTAPATTQSAPPSQPGSFGVRAPTAQSASPTSPQHSQGPPQLSLNPLQQSPKSTSLPFQGGRGGPPNGGFRGPPSAGSPQGPPQYGHQQARPGYGPPGQVAPGAHPQYQAGPRGPSAGMQNGPNGSSLAPTNPVFGLSLDALFRRDDSAVPLVVYQCVQAVDLFGLEVEGIYRLSGNTAHIQQLRAAFDHDSSKIDFRNPSAFHHDVNSVAGLLKSFFRDLPDPLMTGEHYTGFIEASKIDDDILRRDSIHAIINNLPDPNYATLRALVLHLNRVQERSPVNRMTTSNLATCFAPTLMGAHRGPNVADSAQQIRVIDTILQNTFQIFDED